MLQNPCISVSESLNSCLLVSTKVPQYTRRQASETLQVFIKISLLLPLRFEVAPSLQASFGPNRVDVVGIQEIESRFAEVDFQEKLPRTRILTQWRREGLCLAHFLQIDTTWLLCVALVLTPGPSVPETSNLSGDAHSHLNPSPNP